MFVPLQVDLLILNQGPGGHFQYKDAVLPVKGSPLQK